MGRRVFALAICFLIGSGLGVPAFADVPHAGGASRVDSKSGVVTEGPALSRVAVSARYAQTDGLWSIYSQVKGAEGDLTGISEVLEQNYGKPSAGFSRVAVRWERGEWALETAAEGAAFGLVRNPVSPQLRANIAVSGIVMGSYRTEHLPTGLEFRFGALLGSGPERQIEGKAVDLLDAEEKVQKGSLRLVGADAEVERKFRPSGDDRIRLNGSIQETYFSSSTPAPIAEASSSSVLAREYRPRFFDHRWRLEAGYDRLVRRIFRGSTVGVEAWVSPDPLPNGTLPRIWSYILPVSERPSDWQAMTGAGLRLRSRLGTGVYLDGRSGYYGGYLGGEAGVKVSSFSASLATWGLDASTVYQLRQIRVWQAGVGLSF